MSINNMDSTIRSDESSLEDDFFKEDDYDSTELLSFAESLSTSALTRAEKRSSENGTEAWNNSCNIRASFNIRENSSRRRDHNSWASFESSSSVASAATPLSPGLSFKKKKISTSQFTINKLKFSSLGIYGREKEIATIEACWDQMVTRSVSRQLLMISGYSGSGKTRLVGLLKGKAQDNDGFYVRGKFGLNMSDRPYLGIANAIAELCGSIVDLQAEHQGRFDELCEAVKKEVGSGIFLLSQAIPTLLEVFDYQENLGDNVEDTGLPNSQGRLSFSSSEYKNQFNFAFLRFMRVICRILSPFVMVLDGLQWADACSLELLEILVTDRENSNLMVIGLYRSNEVDETNIFYRTREFLTEKSEEGCFQLASFSIGELDVDAVHQIIQKLLSADGDNRTLTLAKLCHRKTEGNAFFLLHFLAMLHQSELLQFNLGTLKWHWDIEEIESTASSSNNVLDLLMSKLTSLSEPLVSLLKMGACLGSTFTWNILFNVWNSYCKPEEKDDVRIFDETVEKLVDGGFLIDISDFSNHELTYAWQHDKIHEAVLSLIPDADLPSFSYQIGEVLLAELDEKDVDASIFVIVNLLNMSSEALIGSANKRTQLAELNCRASRKAMASSAFESAAIYAGRGIQLLANDCWIDCYDLSLSLYSIGAASAGSVGDIKRLEEYCMCVINLEDIPIEDKFDVYNTWIDSLINRGLHNDAMGWLFTILGKFDCYFPTNPIPVAFAVIKAMYTMEAKLKSIEVSSMVKLQNPTTFQLMKLMDKLTTCLYQTGDVRLPLMSVRIMNWSLQRGYCEWSPPALAWIGTIMTGVLHDLRGGSNCGQQALVLSEKVEEAAGSARTRFLVHALCFSWTKPWNTLVKPLFETYTIGLQTGDTDSASWAIFFCLTLRFMLGTPLENLKNDTLSYSKQMKDLKRDITFFWIGYLRQVVENLSGMENEEDPTSMKGDAISVEDYKTCLEDQFLQPGLVIMEGLLLTYFGKHVDCADLTIKYGPRYFAKKLPSVPSHMWEAHLKGVSCFAAAQETGKRKYARVGRFFLKRMKSWSKQGNPNVFRYQILLEAEDFAWRGKAESAVQKYETAIIQSARGGFQQDAALASERLAHFSLTVMHDTNEWKYRMEEACRYYEGWGAHAKSKALKASMYTSSDIPSLPRRARLDAAGRVIEETRQEISV